MAATPDPHPHRSPAQLTLHAQAGLVPEATPPEYRELLADVSERGVVTPLEVTGEDVLLDGRQRLRAARELGLAEVPVTVLAPADEVAHMLLAALRRRHLSASQRAALALELADYRQARERGRLRSLANLQPSDVATLPHRGERSRELAARLVGASARSVQDAITVKGADPELFQQVKEGRIPVGKAARRIRQAERNARLPAERPMPEGPFELLLADPPWRLQGDPESAWAPENHYPTMSAADLQALELPAAQDAVLFLWVTGGVFRQGLELMASWGFQERSQLVWVKPSPGIGQWVRYQHELLLIGRRGRYPAPEPELRPSSLIEAPRGRHSEKPEAAYRLIERMYPEASKLELFARRPRPGWQAWGNELAA